MPELIVIAASLSTRAASWPRYARPRGCCWKPSCSWPTTGLETNARPCAARCPRCQRRRGVQSCRTRQVQTRVGPIRLRRWWHQCWACARGWSPSDQALELAPYQQTSPGLARWEAAVGAITTFREAAKLLADLAGVHVGSETLRTQAERVGTELEGRQRASMAVVEHTHEPPAPEYDPAHGTLVVETDGVMVRSAIGIWMVR